MSDGKSRTKNKRPRSKKKFKNSDKAKDKKKNKKKIRLSESDKKRPTKPKLESGKKKKLNENGEREKRKHDPYQKLKLNLYPPDKIKPRNAGTRCGCEPTGMPGCNSTDCLNFMMFVECDAGKCALGPLCQNTRLRHRKYCKTAVKYFGKKGWGLYAKEDLKPETLVIEYVGEIIDAERKEDRLYEGRTTKKFYMMTLNAYETIDATEKGNRSRFLNHCCDPNCVTQKWLVEGMERIGVFTKTFVPQGAELTYNYFGDMGSDNQKFFGSIKQPCFCGSPRCGKWLGAKPIRLPGDDERDAAANALVEERKTRKLALKETIDQRFLRISQAFLGHLDLSKPNGSFPTQKKRVLTDSLEIPQDSSNSKESTETLKSSKAKKVGSRKKAQKTNVKGECESKNDSQIQGVEAKVSTDKDVLPSLSPLPRTVPLFLQRNLAICKPIMRRMVHETLEEFNKQFQNQEEYKILPGIYEKGGRLVHLAKDLGQKVEEKELVFRGRPSRVSRRHVT